MNNTVSFILVEEAYFSSRTGVSPEHAEPDKGVVEIYRKGRL
jgi:hypothetical protein